ncbi:MAG: hypothetical protein ACR2HJ_06995 [Fimbriimonadales bacterium]
MKLLPLISFVAFAGCGSKSIVPDEPTYGLVIPKANSEWRREIIAGFQDAADQVGMKISISEYSDNSPKEILAAASNLPPSEGAPICIVFTRKESIKDVAFKLARKGVDVITIGEDDPDTPRIGHCGEASQDLAYLWDIRVRQLRPRPRNALMIFGDVPVNQRRISGSLYEKSRGWRRYRLRMRSVADASQDDIKWADLVTPVGEDALAFMAGTSKPMIPVDGSAAAIDLVRGDRVPMVFIPNYYQMGLRAARIAREDFVYGTIPNAIISMKYKEVVKETVKWHLEDRYRSAPSVAKRK